MESARDLYKQYKQLTNALVDVVVVDKPPTPAQDRKLKAKYQTLKAIRDDVIDKFYEAVTAKGVKTTRAKMAELLDKSRFSDIYGPGPKKAMNNLLKIVEPTTKRNSSKYKLPSQSALNRGFRCGRRK